MEAITHLITAFYNAVPEWIVGLALIIAGGSFVLTARWQHIRGVMGYLWPLALGVAAALTLLGLSYIWLWLAPDTPIELWRGAMRMILLVTAAALTAYNGGAMWLSYDSTIQQRRRRALMEARNGG